MKRQILKILKATVVGLTVLTFCAAPALQAAQISSTIEQLDKPCGCCCCEVGQQTPLNSAPVVSTTFNDNQNKIAVSVLSETSSILAQSGNFYKLIASDNLPKKHPRLFMLHASLLI